MLNLVYASVAFRWYRREKIDKNDLTIIQPNDSIYPTSGTLIIKYLTPRMTGVYTCQVNNSVGSQTMDIKLTVTGDNCLYFLLTSL